MQSFNTYLGSTIHITFAHIFRPERYADSDAAKADMRAKVPKSLIEQFQLVEDRLSDGREWVHGARYTVSDPYLYVFARWLERDGAGSIDSLPQSCCPPGPDAAAGRGAEDPWSRKARRRSERAVWPGCLCPQPFR